MKGGDGRDVDRDRPVTSEVELRSTHLAHAQYLKARYTLRSARIEEQRRPYDCRLSHVRYLGERTAEILFENPELLSTVNRASADVDLAPSLGSQTLARVVEKIELDCDMASMYSGTQSCKLRAYTLLVHRFDSKTHRFPDRSCHGDLQYLLST